MRGYTHECLRAETRRFHDLLDGSLPLSEISGRDGYIRCLLTNWPCAAIEQALENAGVHRLLPDWNYRRRRFELADDLAALGVALPPLPSFRIANEVGTILGCSYVLEGSRLGAKIILPALELNATAEIRAATRFLRHGSNENHWESFKTALRRIDGDLKALADACEAAIAAFEMFIGSSIKDNRCLEEEAAS
jgi:heme oxygenase (biliverdin-IX-beta and delta-forming)